MSTLFIGRVRNENARTAASPIIFGFTVVTIVAVFCASVYCYFGSSYFYVFDDTALIELAAANSVGKILGTSFTGFYRPLTLLFVKLQAAAFGWKHPQGYILVSLLIHGLNVILLYGILWKCGLRIAAAAGAVLFLIAPFSVETFLWVSCQFDLLAVLMLLLAAWCFVVYLECKKRIYFGLAVVCYGAALFAKENMIVFFLVFYGLLAWRQGLRSACQSSLLLVPFIVAAAAYLGIRSAVVGPFHGAYGNMLSLVLLADIPQNLAAFARTIADISQKIPGEFAWAAYWYTGAFCGFILIALRYHTGLVASLILFFCVALVPVIWGAPSHLSSSNTRFVYAPAAFLVTAAAIGIETSLAGHWPGPWSRPLLNVIGSAGALGLLFIAALSTVVQVDMWRLASTIARRSVDYVLIVAWNNPAKPLHLVNLPSQLIEGPYIMKPYNLFHYAKGVGRPIDNTISYDLVKLSYRDPELVLPSENQVSKPGANRHPPVIEVVIPYPSLRRYWSLPRIAQ